MTSLPSASLTSPLVSAHGQLEEAVGFLGYSEGQQELQLSCPKRESASNTSATDSPHSMREEASTSPV
jgi:hypothetical protein